MHRRCRGALANPQEVCGGVVGQLSARVDAGEGTLVVHYQSFVADVHIGGLSASKLTPQASMNLRARPISRAVFS